LKASTRAVEDKIPAVIGGELSEESIVIGDTLAASKTVFITPTSSNPQVTENKPFVFRSCFSDTLVAGQLAHFTADNLNPTAIGLVHNVSSPYTDFLSKRFMETIKEIAAKNPKKAIPVIEEKVLRDTRDFGPQIDSFIKGGVTHVAMMTHQSDLLKFAIQAADKNFFPVYIGSDGWGSNEHVYKNLVVEPAHKKFVAFRNSYWKQDATTPIATEFKKTYAKEQLREPNAWGAISFDAAWVLFNSMDKARKPSDGESIRKAMVAIKDIHLVTAEHFKFGPDNSPRKDLYIYKIDKTGINYEATLK
jgi:branched-chain amino acid transport system substrate-binding protein